jgi:hypothetical protein
MCRVFVLKNVKNLIYNNFKILKDSKMFVFLISGQFIPSSGKKLDKNRNFSSAASSKDLKLNAREKTLDAGEKFENFETHFRIK